MTSRTVSLTLGLFVVSIPLVNWALDAGVALTLAQVLGMVLVGIAAVTWMRFRPPIPRDTAVLSLGALLVVCAITVVLAQLAPDVQFAGESSHAKSIKQLAGLVFGATVFIALYCLMRWHGLGPRMLRIHYWTTVVIAALALIQYGIATIDMASPLANFEVHNSTMGVTRPLSLLYGFPRVSLTLVEPSMLGLYLLSGWAFWLYALGHDSPFASGDSRRFKWSGVLIGIAIMITGSRLAYLVVGTLAVGALAVRPMRLRRAALVGVSVLVGMALTGSLRGQSVVATFLPKSSPATVTPSVVGTEAGTVEAAAGALESAVTSRDISVQYRTASYIVALRALRENPILGIGLGTSPFYIARNWPSSFGVPWQGRVDEAPIILSHYATIAAENGLLGLICYVTFALAAVSRPLRLAWSGHNEAAMAWGAGASVTSYYLIGLAMPLMWYQILLFWLLLAMSLTVQDERLAPSGSAPPRSP